MRAILIDSNGNVLLTDIRRNLKIEPATHRDGFVRLKMKHDSLEFAKESPTLLEKRYLAHKGPNTKQVSMVVDVLKAVRLLKHIREGYDNEKEKITMLFNHISNSILLVDRHSKRSDQCEEDLAVAQSLISSCVCNMKHVRSFYKVLSKVKLENATKYIDNALQATNDFEMNMYLKPASSILYAAKRRLEARLDSVNNLKSYNLQREMFLRGMRDMYIRRRLISLATWLTSSPDKTIDAYMFDMNVYNRLVRLRDRCRSDEMKDMNRFPRFQEDLEALATHLKYVKGKEYVVQSLREIYVLALKYFMFDAAYTRLDRLVAYIGINKPFYMSAQLEETKDTYTEPLISYLNEIDEQLLSRNPKAALKAVENAIDVCTKYLKVQR